VKSYRYDSNQDIWFGEGLYMYTVGLVANLPIGCLLSKHL